MPTCKSGNVLCLANVLLTIIWNLYTVASETAYRHEQMASHQYPVSSNEHHGITYSGSKHRHPGYTSGSCHLDTVSWAVKITDQSLFQSIFGRATIHDKADVISRELHLINEGPIGHFTDIYLFAHPYNKLYMISCPDSVLQYKDGSLENMQAFQPEVKPWSFNTSVKNDSADISVADLLRLVRNDTKTGMDQFNPADIIKNIEHELDQHRYVDWYTRQTVRRRSKRSFYFNDPAFDLQWHLVNTAEITMDINVTGVWERGVTGKNVVAVVVDDGLDWTVPDIHLNYNSRGSWDLNSNDANPLPDTSNEHNHHGTRCAGEIAAAANNKYCGVGVAYNAGIAGIRVLDGPMTDSLEATAFTKNFDVNDVYSCSWGPDDDGKTVDGPHHLANIALRHGVEFGRQGYGSIYVVASGNGGSAGDNCNYDGYANSIFTITIGAVDETGHMPYYAEECASMLAVTFSSGGSLMRSIVTTDWLHHDGVGCTTQHTGTSAAAPLAAGMIVLMLSARPCLTWRDVQHIIIITAVKVDIDVAQWQRNAAGLHHSHKHGFGLMDAWRLVNAAKIWEPVPWMTVFTTKLQIVNDRIIGGSTLTYSYEVTSDQLAGYNLNSLEYVQVTVTIQHHRRGDLQIMLHCPSNTYSVLGAYRPKDNSEDGFNSWTFSTVRCWGERPEGLYRVELSDQGKESVDRGLFVNWKLKLFGSALSYDDMQERMRKVKDSYSGTYLNASYQATCTPPPDNVQVTSPLSERILKILVLTGVFATFMAIYESFEYIFCYDNEKKEHSKLMALYKRAQGLAANRAPDDCETSTERETLLHRATSYDSEGETIPLQDFLSVCHEDQHASSSALAASNIEADSSGGNISQSPDHEVPLSGPSQRCDASTGKSSKHPNGSTKNRLHKNTAAVTDSELESLTNPCTPSIDEMEYDQFVCSENNKQTK